MTMIMMMIMIMMNDNDNDKYNDDDEDYDVTGMYISLQSIMRLGVSSSGCNDAFMPCPM